MGLAKELLNDKELIEFSKEYSIAEYFMLDEESDLRLEFINGHIRAMSGGSERHNHIINNCLSLLHLHLKGKPCKVYNQSMKLDASSKRHGAYYYPDLVISCKTPHVVDNVVKQPCVAIEVLSPSTSHIDRFEKRLIYTEIPSMELYLLIHQKETKVEIWRRQDTTWAEEILTEGIIDIPAISYQLNISDIYDELP